MRNLVIETHDPGSPFDGSGPLGPAIYGPLSTMRVYHQPDRTALGYNPNEEHALLAPSADPAEHAPVLFALRMDLNRPLDPVSPYATGDTSRPYVLLKYQDPLAGGEWAFEVYQVDAYWDVGLPGHIPFRREGISGEELAPPYPLGALPGMPCSESTRAAGSGPAHQDKNGVWYALEPVAGQPVVLNLWYPLQPGMWYDRDNDGVADVASGTCIAWELIHAGETTARPIDVTYDIDWPDDIPTLPVGKTLMAATGGLPEIRGQCSVRLLYNNAPGPEVVRLVDPLVERSVELAVPAFRPACTGRGRLPDLPVPASAPNDLNTQRHFRMTLVLLAWRRGPHSARPGKGSAVSRPACCSGEPRTRHLDGQGLVTRRANRPAHRDLQVIAVTAVRRRDTLKRKHHRRRRQAPASMVEQLRSVVFGQARGHVKHRRGRLGGGWTPAS